MGALPDWMIQRDVGITPFAEAIKRPGKISYGCGSYGYDMRVGYIFDVFSPINATEIDPKNFDKNCLVRKDLTNTEGQHLLIPPHSFALAESLEHFVIPRDTICIVIGKSTYARCGLVVNCTPLEPEWEGIVTLELSNTTPLPMRIYPGEGIAQCVFIRTDGYRDGHEQYGATCAVSYADKGGKYQKQSGLTLPTVDKKA